MMKIKATGILGYFDEDGFEARENYGEDFMETVEVERMICAMDESKNDAIVRFVKQDPTQEYWDVVWEVVVDE